ncbi:MAG: glycoside hydrolase family 3 C-terminal domain-containing protein [Gemmatimonadota bacterium]
MDTVKRGEVAESAIDAAVRRLLRAKVVVGLFEQPFVDPAAADSISGAAAHRALALEAARQSIVQLKNEGGALPLRGSSLKRVALIGPHATEVLLGGYAGTPRFTGDGRREICYGLSHTVRVQITAWGVRSEWYEGVGVKAVPTMSPQAFTA